MGLQNSRNSNLSPGFHAFLKTIDDTNRQEVDTTPELLRTILNKLTDLENRLDKPPSLILTGRTVNEEWEKLTMKGRY